jgi:hypothetical protein
MNGPVTLPRHHHTPALASAVAHDACVQASRLFGLFYSERRMGQRALLLLLLLPLLLRVWLRKGGGRRAEQAVLVVNMMHQLQQKAAAAGRVCMHLSHRLILSQLRKPELSQLFRPVRNPITSLIITTTETASRTDCDAAVAQGDGLRMQGQSLRFGLDETVKHC